MSPEPSQTSAAGGPAIRVDGIGKRYRIGARAERPDTLGGLVGGWLRAPFANLRELRRLTAETEDANTLWALRDASFEVPRGRVLGIIGRNGAGKTTLLKILSRITEPTTGRAEIRGRVASLLEVGTGFHQELTGRENVYLNGTILGMHKAEIDTKLDEITAFSGVERFLDTPIKRYSAGMKVRLAFSVAAHLEPEILLIDEVLAVGDLAFQQKCLGKMDEVAQSGRTVLFVSHQLGMVKSLCDQVLVLEEGRVAFLGDLEEGIRRYTESVAARRPADTGRREFGWSRVVANGRAGRCPLEPGEPLTVEAELELPSEASSGGHVIAVLTDAEGTQVVHESRDLEALAAGPHLLRLELPPLWLAPGFYTLQLKFLGIGERAGGERALSPSLVLDVTGHASGGGKRPTLLAPRVRWEHRPGERLDAASVAVPSDET